MRLTATIFLIVATFATPAVAEGDWNWDIVSTNFGDGDPFVMYMATPRSPDLKGENLVTLVRHHLRAAPRTEGVSEYDEVQFSYRINCRDRSYTTLSARFENQDVVVYDNPVEAKAQGINPASDLGTAAEMTCDNDRSEAQPMAMLNHDADAKQKLAVLAALEKSDAGGEWSKIGTFGDAPARMTAMVDRISTGFTGPARRTITVQYAMERPEDGTAVVRYLHHVEVDCDAQTLRIAFQAGLSATGEYRIGGFTTTAPAAAQGSALVAGVCKGDWSATSAVTGIGSWVGTHAFTAPAP